MASQAWKHLNEEEQAFFRGTYAKMGRAAFIGPGVLEKLATRPVTRVAWWWKFAEGRHALSPFAIAGITKHSPQEVLEQLLVERADGSMQLCSETQLPVLFLDLWWEAIGSSPKIKSFTNYYDSDLANHFTTDPYHPTKAHFGDFPYEARCFETMMREYGGEDYKRFCTRYFDPFKTYTCTLTTNQWRNLREAYLGRSLRRKVK